MAHAQVQGGSEIVHTEVVPRGLAGRSLEEQVLSRIRSRANRQRDRGYVDSYEAARDLPRTNALDLPHPMLAKKIDDLRRWPGKAIVQPKLDGFRCLVTRNGEGQVICYTRGGKVLDALTHVTRFLESYLPEGIVLDGEIYEHGKPLQTLASLAKRKQPGTENLRYHVYDCIDEGTFQERYRLAERTVDHAGGDGVGPIVMVKNRLVSSLDDVWEHFAEFREQGYEGAMLRLLDAPYEAGNRSANLLKVKARNDDEFLVYDVEEDRNGNALLCCAMPSGKKFKTSAPGNFDQKKFVLAHRDQFVGRMVTVEYANLTQDGIPFHAVATRWKELV